MVELVYAGNSLKSGVYQISNKVNGRVYIGSAKEFKCRWRQHVNSLKRGKHHNSFLQADYNTHGTNAFLIEVLELVEGDKNYRLLAEEKALEERIAKSIAVYNFPGRIWSSDGCFPKDPKLTALRKQLAAKNRCRAQPELLTNLHIAQQKYFSDHPEEKKKIAAMGGAQTYKTITLISPENKIVEIINVSRFAKEHKLDPDALMAVFNKEKNIYREWIAVDSTRSDIEMKQKLLHEPKNVKNCYFNSPDGILTKVENLSKFCRDNNLSQGSMSMVLVGKRNHHHGWTKPSIDLVINEEFSGNYQ